MSAISTVTQERAVHVVVDQQRGKRIDQTVRYGGATPLHKAGTSELDAVNS